jgi:hypothetical protein
MLIRYITFLLVICVVTTINHFIHPMQSGRRVRVGVNFVKMDSSRLSLRKIVVDRGAIGRKYRDGGSTVRVAIPLEVRNLA